MDDEGLLWTGTGAAATLGASALARKGLARAWTKRKGYVPDDPNDDRVTWREAVVFAVVSGAAVGLSRLVADRAMREVKERRRPAAGSAPATA